MISINVTGPDKSGKGHVIASIAHALRAAGCNVTVQCEETHNGKKLSKSDEEISARLKDTSVVITEMQTNS